MNWILVAPNTQTIDHKRVRRLVFFLFTSHHSIFCTNVSCGAYKPLNTETGLFICTVIRKRTLFKHEPSIFSLLRSFPLGPAGTTLNTSLLVFLGHAASVQRDERLSDHTLTQINLQCLLMDSCFSMTDKCGTLDLKTKSRCKVKQKDILC